jgi:hypothetical protein
VDFKFWNFRPIISITLSANFTGFFIFKILDVGISNLDNSQENLEPLFVFEPHSELLSKKTSEFDKIVENQLGEMASSEMIKITKDSGNFLYSKSESYFKQSKRNSSSAIDEGTIMKRLGGTESYDLASMGETANPEEHLMNCLERGVKGMKKMKNGLKSKQPYFMNLIPRA